METCIILCTYNAMYINYRCPCVYIHVKVCFSACKSTRNTTLCKLCGQLVQTQSQRSSHANYTNLMNSEKI